MCADSFSRNPVNDYVGKNRIFEAKRVEVEEIRKALYDIQKHSEIPCVLQENNKMNITSDDLNQIVGTSLAGYDKTELSELQNKDLDLSVVLKSVKYNNPVINKL